MKKLLVALLAVFVVAGCSIFGSDGSDMFGAWEKVSSDRGEYRGVEGASLSKVASVVSSSAADTIEADTSFVNSDEQLSITITPHSPSDAPNDFYVSFVDSTPPGYDYYHTDVKYVTDSTSLSYTEVTNGSNNTNRISRESLFENNCTGQQADEEHLIFSITNSDSSKMIVYDIRVDGMKDIVSDIVSCN